MDGLIIKKLIWNDSNINHIQKHEVTQVEVEKSLQDIFVVFIKGHSNRVMSLGRSGKRLVTTVLQGQNESNTFYVVTARDMAKKERIIYRQEKLKKEGGSK